ncbi:MAG: hypothetical protein LCH52_12425 [Bacteroidetes bacterium]|nr:hypothetical protein [Bacteroidota bacterium]
MRSITVMLLLFFAVSVTEAQRTEKVVSMTNKILVAPQESPDGKTIAFTQEGYNGIFLMNSNREIKELTADNASGFGFRWLNDNSGIVARSARFIDIRRENSVVIYSLNGENTLQLSEFSGRMTIMPSVSTSGDICFVENGTLKSYDPLTKNSSLSSPKGIAAFIENDKISVVSAGSAKRVIEPVKGQRCINATLSPDGSRIAFEILGGNLYLINSDGSGLVDLGRGYRAAWSPDSKYISYMLTEDDGHFITGSELYIVKTDGSGKKMITNSTDKIEMNPSFSADGKSIYFDNATDGAIYKMEVEAFK